MDTYLGISAVAVHDNGPAGDACGVSAETRHAIFVRQGEERLDALRSLAGVPVAEAAATAGALARTLAIEASGSFPSVRAEARQLTTTIPARQRSLHDPVPGQWIALAVRLAAVGAPERSVADLLWTRADELPDAQAITGLLGIIVENGNLDQAKATAWGFVRTIDYWLWGLGNGFTVDPVRCRRIASALAPLAGHGRQP